MRVFRRLNLYDLIRMPANVINYLLQYIDTKFMSSYKNYTVQIYAYQVYDLNLMLLCPV